MTITHPDGRQEALLKMAARGLGADTVVETKTGGGGGNGDPMQRPFEEVAQDVKKGFLTAQAARRDYGVVVEAHGTVDEAASSPR